MKKILLFTALLFISLPAYAQQGYNGRFEIVDTDAGVYMIDTATGQTWVPMIRTLENGVKIDYWDPRIKFDSFTQKVQYFAPKDTQPEPDKPNQ